VTVYGARPRRARVSPHVAQQLLAGEHARGLRGQAAQQLVLLRGQLHAIAVDPHLARGEVDLELAQPQHPAALGALCAAEQGAQAGAQLGVAVRLGEHVVAAALQVAHTHELFGARGKDQQRRVRVDPARQSVRLAHRVDQRQRLAVDIGEHQLGLAGAQQRERLLLAVGLEHLEAVGRQVLGEERSRGGVLLGEQDGVSGLRHSSLLHFDSD
jgi:hypothetical protein